MKPNFHISEQNLVHRLKERDERALGILYDRYSAALYGIALKIVRDEAMAEDVLQEGFVKIWRSIERYDAQKGSIFTWMLNVVRNLAIDKTRSKHFKNQQKTQPLENTHAHQPKTNLNTDGIGVQKIVEQTLSDTQQEVINFLYFRGYTHTEAAKELNIPLGTLKTRARSALKRLRQVFA